MTYAKVDPTADGSLAFRSSYDPRLVQELKDRIPYTDRRWDPDNRCWLVTPAHVQTLAAIVQQTLGVQLQQTQRPSQAIPRTEQRLLKVEYIGAPKERDDGSFSAFGYCDGEWSVIFPQDVLKNWFELGGAPEEEPQPSQATTLYGVLGVKRTVDEREIKRAWRKMAKRWHPDINHDPDAPEMMQRVNDAYDVLSNPMLRKKYDAGLKLEASLKQNQSQRSWSPSSISWRPPIRCGYILVEGVSQLGRFHVEKILAWEDIVDGLGRTMVTSWAMGAEHFTVSWI